MRVTVNLVLCLMGESTRTKRQKEAKKTQSKKRMTMTSLSGLSVGCGPTRWGFYCLEEEQEVRDLKVLACEATKQNSRRDALY